LFGVIGEILKRNLIGVIQIVAIPLIGLFLFGQYIYESSYEFFFSNDDYSLEAGQDFPMSVPRELIIGSDRKYLMRYSLRPASAIDTFSPYVAFIEIYDLNSGRSVLSKAISKESLIKHANGRDSFQDEVMDQLMTLSNNEDNRFANAIIPNKAESTIVISGKNWITKGGAYYTELGLEKDTALDLSGLADSYVHAKNRGTELPHFIRFRVNSAADSAEVQYSSNQGKGKFTMTSVSSYFPSGAYPETFETFKDYLIINSRKEGSINWIYVFDRKSGDLVRELCCTEGWTSRVISSEAGSNYIASGGDGDHSIKLWNLSNLQK